MFPHNENPDETADASTAKPQCDGSYPPDDPNPEPKKLRPHRPYLTGRPRHLFPKRIKHGACAKTLILPHESVADWELLLSRWCGTYQPNEDVLEFEFVLKTAQAEWFRLRAQRNYDDFLASLGTIAPFAWSPGEIKTHDLMFRYKTAAERSFQREYRLLEQHYKVHKPNAKPSEPAESHPSKGSTATRESHPTTESPSRSIPGLRIVSNETGKVVESSPGGWYSPETGFVPDAQ